MSMHSKRRAFFAHSELLDYLVVRPLSHITLNWELTWDGDKGRYRPEADSFSTMLNEVIEALASCSPPKKYHDHEDRLAEYAAAKLGWPIRKEGNRWIGYDYDLILEQGGGGDVAQAELLAAASGRVQAAIDRGQNGFDEMEDGHRRMLAAVMTIILYHRYCEFGLTQTAEGD